jgi:hypothetical protein
MSSEPENIHTALAALADGTLTQERREAVLARVAESPELAGELEDQRRAVTLVRSLERVEAPTLLRRSIELAAGGDLVTPGAGRPGAEVAAGAMSGRVRDRAARRSLSSRLSPRLAGAVAFAAVAVVLALVLTTGGSTSAPTVLQASGAGLRTASGAAPAESSHNPHLLAASAVGISYPYWGGKLGWRAVGARTDTVGGRIVTTVFYANARAQRIGYSIVAGSVLAIPAGSTAVEHRGVGFHVLNHAGPTIVTWREAGHTCILTARGVSAGTLMRLVTWQRA